MDMQRGDTIGGNMLANTRIVYKQLATLVQARRNCLATNNTEWFEKHTELIRLLIRDFMPSGSGWDHGTTLDLDKSHGDKLVFGGAYHHMNDAGYYDGWTQHHVTVKPSLQFGYCIRIDGSNRNDIKDYLVDTFAQALETQVTWDVATERYSRV